jgi:hypothetical protein
MLIGFLGDLHGRVFLALAVLATWQRRAGRRFDLIVQVGDLGAFPRPVASDANPHLVADPAENDFSRLLAADGALADRLRQVRAELGRAVHFLRGNHEDFDYLRSLAADPATGTAAADPFDLYRYVPDGAILRCGDLRVAALGGVEEQTGDAGIDLRAYDALLAMGAGAFDVLAAHEGHYGSSTGYLGDTHGSPMVSRLVAATRPRYLVFGHAH